MKGIGKESRSTTGKSPEEVREILNKVGNLLEEAGIPALVTAVYSGDKESTDDEVISYLSNFNCSHLTLYEMFYSIIIRKRSFMEFFIAFGLTMKKLMDDGNYDKIEQLYKDNGEDKNEDKTPF